VNAQPEEGLHPKLRAWGELADRELLVRRCETASPRCDVASGKVVDKRSSYGGRDDASPGRTGAYGMWRMRPCSWLLTRPSTLPVPYWLSMVG
jgi:hypothetical protein